MTFQRLLDYLMSKLIFSFLLLVQSLVEYAYIYRQNLALNDL